MGIVYSILGWLAFIYGIAFLLDFLDYLWRKLTKRAVDCGYACGYQEPYGLFVPEDGCPIHDKYSGNLLKGNEK